MIDEATEQLADLNQRSEQVRREAGKITADARKRAQETVQAAERQAANLLENSNKQARERARELETRTLAEQQAAEQRLTAVRDERDQIEAYLEQMRELVGRMPLMSSKKQESQESTQGNAPKQGTAPKQGASRPQNG
jgi:vacuolar-type H+-ATPase subunit H